MTLVAVVACDRRAAPPRADSPASSSAPRVVASTEVRQLTPPSETDSSGGAPWLDSMIAPGTHFDRAVVDTISRSVVCYAFPHYVVVNRTFERDVGSDNFVRRRPESALDFRPLCASDSLPGDYVIRNADADWYQGLYGRWLVLERETGAATTLLVFDVDARRRIAQFDGELVKWRDSVSVLLWTDPDSVPVSVCPRWGATAMVGVESLMVVDVRTSAVTRTGRWRCTIRQ